MNVANIGSSHHTRDSKGVPKGRENPPSPPTHSSALDFDPYLTGEDVALAHYTAKKVIGCLASRTCYQPAFQILLKIFP